jgi:hypothetical protein
MITSTQIVADSKNISLTSDAKNAGFCTVWPSAKEGLQLLEAIIKNPIAKGAIGIVIAAGDAVAKEICG